MRVVKTYENFLEFDIDFAMAKIKHHFSDYDVKNMVDDEIENWVDDSNLGQEYENKREWYDKHGAGEAEEVVADEIVDWYEKEFSKELDDKQRENLYNLVLKTYDTLQH